MKDRSVPVRFHGAPMSTDDDDDLRVDCKDDQTRHDVDDSHLYEHHAALFTADGRHENLPVEAPLDRRICGLELDRVVLISRPGSGQVDLWGRVARK